MKMQTVMAAGGLLMVFSAATQAGCNGLGATYEMTGAQGFSLVLVRAAEPNAYSDLEAVLQTPTRKLNYTFAASNGYSMNYLVEKGPAEDAQDEGSFRFYGFDEKLNLTDLPSSKAAAPPLVFVPDLGPKLYYGESTREFLPVGMWRLTCRE
jgi:hypothetical protein